MAPLLYFAAAESHLHFETRSFSPLGGLLSQSDSGAKFMRSLAHNNAGEIVETREGRGRDGVGLLPVYPQRGRFYGIPDKISSRHRSVLWKR